MLQMGSVFNLADNSGARKVECIKVLKKHPKSAAFLGDFIIVSVKQLRSKGNLRVKKKDVCLALVFRTRYRKKRLDNRFFFFFNNVVILLNNSLKPYGTRFFGPVVKELKKKKLKVIALSSNYF
jgi:large subunit ribosomal protein L14